ncbi:hypothetical protein ICV35_26725 [Rhodococcus ruber]|uniref:hypothetical protein n=1 Tax=Rhodococcus ruber TaxID=1830 RepID=UPI00177C0367|nr:hypothetical protein [Rhodococcus ruber]MBD8057235.1 hypothetical protein [Rhodococcus ruber]
MTDARSWERGNSRVRRETEAALYREFPELRDALTADDPDGTNRPVVQLRCPRGHALEKIVLDGDHNGHPIIRTWREYATGEEHDTPSVRNASPFAAAPDDLSAPRIRLQCRRCAYQGVHTQARLLRLFAVALRLDMRDLRIPS